MIVSKVLLHWYKFFPTSLNLFNSVFNCKFYYVSYGHHTLTYTIMPFILCWLSQYCSILSTSPRERGERKSQDQKSKSLLRPLPSWKPLTLRRSKIYSDNHKGSKPARLLVQSPYGFFHNRPVSVPTTSSHASLFLNLENYFWITFPPW